MCLASPGRKSKLVFSVQKNTKPEKVAKGQATECCVGPGKFDIHNIFRSLTPAQFQLLFELSCLWIHWINVSNSFSIKQSQGFIYHWWLLLSGSGSHSGKRCCKLLLNLPAYLVSSQTNLTETFSSSTWRKVVKKNWMQIEWVKQRQNRIHYILFENTEIYFMSLPLTLRPAPFSSIMLIVKDCFISFPGQHHILIFDVCFIMLYNKYLISKINYSHFSS